MGRGLVAAVLLAGALIAGSPAALAADVLRDLTQYTHTAWTGRDGLKGSIRAIVQTPDGYLWLGTEFGLVRFDGTRFVPQVLEAGARPADINVIGMMAARDGTLWIGTLNGLLSLHDGTLTRYPELSGGLVYELLQDREGTVWAASFRGLCSIRAGKVDCTEIEAPPGRPVPYYIHGNRGHSVYSLYEDGDGRLWAGTEEGLLRWRPGPPQYFPSQSTQVQQGLVRGDKGQGLVAIIIAGDDRALRQIGSDGRAEYDVPGIGPPLRPQRLLRDHYGALWVGTLEHGLFHVANGKVTRFSQGNGLSGNLVSALFEDKEGNVWVGTTNGLDRFREPAISTLSSRQGLSTPAWSVLAARDGSVWICSQSGLNRWQGGRMKVYRAKSLPRASLSAPGPAAGEATEVTDRALPGNQIGSLFEDARGRIWVSTLEGAAWFENESFTRVSGAPFGSAIAILSDPRGGVLMASLGAGMSRAVDARVVESVSWPWSQEARNPRLSSVARDPASGDLWASFLNGGIARLKDGKVTASMGSNEGLGAGAVWNFHFDHERTLWVATDGGLSRISQGRVATLTMRNGLPCDAVHWVIEDDAFALWLDTACGLLRIQRADIDAWASDPQRAVHPLVFDGSDGVRTHAMINGFTPVVSKAPDGRLWMAHLDGVSVIDPAHLRLNALPPPVHIEQVTADGESHRPASGLRLPPGVRDLSIDYTALSLTAPEKVRFRFKLEGQDPDWREVVNVRHVQYSNLAPGNYRFRVIAANNSGVWNEEGASLDFSVAPAYWQTNWFRALCVLAFMALLWALYQLRVRHLRSQFNMTLDARVGERTRIARELHDTLLQSFQGLLLRFQTVYEMLPGRPAAAKETLGGAIDQTANAITEGRKAVQGLRASTVETNDLALALTSLGDELAAEASGGTRAEVSIAIEGTSRALMPIVRDEVYRIAAEGLRNAFRHAAAKEIEVELRYDPRQLRLRIHDDGKGIAAEYLAAEGREGHFGLHGMRERAKLMGGRFTIWTAPDSGTEIELTIPAAHAYPDAAPRRSWLDKLSVKSTQSGP